MCEEHKSKFYGNSVASLRQKPARHNMRLVEGSSFYNRILRNFTSYSSYSPKTCWFLLVVISNYEDIDLVKRGFTSSMSSHDIHHVTCKYSARGKQK